VTKSIKNMAGLYVASGRVDEAIVLFKKVNIFFGSNAHREAEGDLAEQK
jgi:hypothetical protein